MNRVSKTDEILKKAIRAAKDSKIKLIIAASTTGETGEKLARLLKDKDFNLIVVTHDEGKPAAKMRFKTDARKMVTGFGFMVYTDNSPLVNIGKMISKLKIFGWDKHLSEIRDTYGEGIKVCHIIMKMLLKDKIVLNERAVVVAGTSRGADSAGIFRVDTRLNWPELEKRIS